jgi:hypothetical protein
VLCEEVILDVDEVTGLERNLSGIALLALMDVKSIPY